MLELVNVSYYRAPKNQKVSPHLIQDGFEYVEILTGGKLIFEVGSREQIFEYGTMFWHIPGDMTIHRYLPDFPYECLCLRFKRAAGAAGRTFQHLTVWENRDEILSFSDRIIREFHDETFNRTVIGQYVYSKIAWEAYSFQRRRPPQEVPEAVTRMLSFIGGNFAEDLAIGDLAKAVGVSVPHLHSLSKKFLRSTPHLILLDKRLQEARRLLATTSEEVKKISADCGFLNVETFCRAFRKKFQTSPGEFRKANSPKHILRDI